MKTIKYTLSAALALFVAASCTKQFGDDFQVSESKGVDVKAVFEAQLEEGEDDASRALLQSNGSLKWENEDKIAVYQFYYYEKDKLRDKTKNIFTSDGSCRFNGEIANYHPLGTGGSTNRYVAGYPADRISTFSLTTGKAKVTIPSTQTGLLSDFKKYAVYFAYMSEYSTTVSYDAEESTLTFLQPFNMFCITPILKFSIPEGSNISKIVLTAKDGENDVKISGTITDFKPYQASTVGTGSAETQITIENSGSVLSGDVYVALAPDLEVAGEGHPQFKSSAKTIVLNLETPQGATATLQMPLTGEVLAGTIKTLPALPTKINWNLLTSPGISKIQINKTDLTVGDQTYSDRTRILITPEDSESVIKYRSRASLSNVEGTTPTNICGEAGILRQDADTPENFLKLVVSTDGYADYNAYACTWILYKNYGFCKDFDAAAKNLSPEVGSTYPENDYLYNLSFEYVSKTTSNQYNVPQINSSGLYIYAASKSYWTGKLHIQAPGTGRAKLFFDYAVTENARSLTVTRGEETIQSLSTGAQSNFGALRVLNTDFFDVQAGDDLTISLSKDVLIYSITLLWEPEVTEAALSTESYSAKTSYGK